MQRAKGGWTSAGERGNIEARKEYGLGTRQLTPQERNINAAIIAQIGERKSDLLVKTIMDNHEALKYYTPESMKAMFEMAGYDVKPLSKSKSGFKGLLFENGGGYKVNFGGDGIFQYHPEGGYHRIEYWKIRNGSMGVKHYDRDGNENVLGA